MMTKTDIPTSDKTAIDSANPKDQEALKSEHKAYKKQLKQLTESKKALSKKIGSLKDANECYKETAIQVQSLNQEIKETKGKLKALNAQIANKDTPAKQVFSQPPQFSTRLKRDTKNEGIYFEVSSSDSAWDQYVEQHPNSTLYHSSAIRNVIENSFGHSNLYLTAKTQNHTICGILPLHQLNSKLFGNSWTAVPFFNYGGALADNPLIETALIDHAAKRVVAKDTHIEIRNTHPLANRPVREDKISMILPLPKESETLWEQLGSKLRAQIKKAQTNNLHFSSGREELLDDYYKIFAQNMRDLGTPVYSKRFFIEMLKQHPSAKICVAYLDNKAVATGFVVGWKNTLEIPWASTLRKANKYNVNMFLYWNILQLAIELGYENFDFGRSSKDASTYKFKKQWGANPQQLYWYYCLPEGASPPQINNNNPKYQMLIKVWQKIPVWLTKIIGPPIVKYIP